MQPVVVLLMAPALILARVEAICAEVEAIEFRHSALWQELAELRDQLRDAVNARQIPSMEQQEAA